MDFTDKLDILYARRSSEDGKDGESIENQVALLKQYAADKGYYNIKVVTDDGYTGTNFNRPGFQEAFALSILNHGFGNPVFDGAGWIEHFKLCYDGGF